MKIMMLMLVAAVTVIGACDDKEVPAGDKATLAREEATAAREVEVVGLDYAFQAPAQLPAGRTVFHFVNRGKVRHEYNMVLLKPGVSMERLLKVVRANVKSDSIIDGPIGVLFAQPGEKPASGIATDLLPGREYAVICIFRDSASAPRHYDLGMYSVIKVPPANAQASTAQPAVAEAATAQPALPPVATDTVIGIDYAFQYSRTVAPGKRTFVFKNEGKVRHQFAISLLKKGVTPEKVFEVEKAKGDVDALFEQDLGLLHAQPGRTPLGQLEIEMLPGREYMIACFFQDDPKSKPHHELGMYGSIKVSGTPAA